MNPKVTLLSAILGFIGSMLVLYMIHLNTSKIDHIEKRLNDVECQCNR